MLANSAKRPSPVVLTIRPRCSRIFGSTSSPRYAFSRWRVPSSSAPIRREYPATSAARIAARRRVEAMAPAAHPAPGYRLVQSYTTTRAPRHREPGLTIFRPGYNLARVGFEIVFAPEAIDDLR